VTRKVIASPGPAFGLSNELDSTEISEIYGDPLPITRPTAKPTITRQEFFQVHQWLNKFAI
jgi:hypothetical protein